MFKLPSKVNSPLPFPFRHLIQGWPVRKATPKNKAEIVFGTLKYYFPRHNPPSLLNRTFKPTPCYPSLNPKFIPIRKSENAILKTLLKFTPGKRNSHEYMYPVQQNSKQTEDWNHWVTMWGSDTNKNEKWLRQIGSSSSNNSKILVSFSLLLEQNIFKYRYIYLYMVYTKVQICLYCYVYIYIF